MAFEVQHCIGERGEPCGCLFFKPPVIARFKRTKQKQSKMRSVPKHSGQYCRYGISLRVFNSMSNEWMRRMIEISTWTREIPYLQAEFQFLHSITNSHWINLKSGCPQPIRLNGYKGHGFVPLPHPLPPSSSSQFPNPSIPQSSISILLLCFAHTRTQISAITE